MSEVADGLRWAVAGGSSGGGSFRHEAGGVLTCLSVWTYGGVIGHVAAWFADGSLREQGGGRGRTCETLEMALGEFITRLVVWVGPWIQHPSYTKSKLATRFEIGTSSGRSFHVGATEGNSTRYEMDVASGIAVGWCGRSGAMLDAFGLIFLDHIQAIELELDDANVTPSQLVRDDEQVIKNHTDAEVQHNILFSSMQRRVILTQVTKGSLLRHGWKASVHVRSKVVEDGGEVKYIGELQNSEDIVNGKETVTERKVDHVMCINVLPQAQAVIKYRNVVSTSTHQNGKWIVRTASGTRAYAFLGVFSTSTTVCHVSHSASRLADAGEFQALVLSEPA